MDPARVQGPSCLRAGRLRAVAVIYTAFIERAHKVARGHEGNPRAECSIIPKTSGGHDSHGLHQRRSDRLCLQL